MPLEARCNSGLQPGSFRDAFVHFSARISYGSGMQTWKPLHDLEASEWDRTIDTNLKGCFLI